LPDATTDSFFLSFPFPPFFAATSKRKTIRKKKRERKREKERNVRGDVEALREQNRQSDCERKDGVGRGGEGWTDF